MAMEKRVILAGVLDSYRSLLDKSVKLSFTTQELSSEDISKIHSLHGEYSKILISNENVIKEVEEAIGSFEIKSDKKVKSMSKQLREILYVLWTKEGGGTSEEHYDQYMEKFITHIKKKIDDI